MFRCAVLLSVHHDPQSLQVKTAAGGHAEHILELDNCFMTPSARIA